MLRYLTFVVAVLLSPPLYAQGAESPRERLSFLVGEWTIEGREDSFREVCAWFDGRSHVVCNSESRTKKGTVRRGVSVFSYSENDAGFKYYHYNNAGVIVAQNAFVIGGGLMTTSESRVGSDLIREQCWMTPRENGLFDFREETSKNGGAWEVTTKVRYVPLKNVAQKVTDR